MPSHFVKAEVNAISLPPPHSYYAGVWQDQSNPTHFFSIHYNERSNAFVLGDLSGIEITHDTLQSTYSSSLILNVIGGGVAVPLAAFKGDNKIQMLLNVDYSGKLTTRCLADPCVEDVVNIIKVF